KRRAKASKAQKVKQQKNQPRRGTRRRQDVIMSRPYRGSGALRTRWISAGSKARWNMPRSVGACPRDDDEELDPDDSPRDRPLDAPCLFLLAISSRMSCVVLCVGSSKAKMT